jgi:hypothetical protein
MAFAELYRRQVALLIRVLSLVAEEKMFRFASAKVRIGLLAVR